MKANVIIRRKPVKLVRTYSLLWDKNEPMVRFDPVLKLFKECNLEVVNMTYYSDNPKIDDHCMIVFDLKGEFHNFDLLELKALHNPDLWQFKNSPD